METIVIRIRLKTLLEIKKEFPAYKDESAADYFNRLSKWLKGGKNGNK